MALKTWVVGSGGLIGSAIARSSGVTAFEAEPVPWATSGASDVLRSELERFTAWVGDDDWAVVWAAGAGVMHTGQDQLDEESALVDTFSSQLGAGAPLGSGGFYLVSSAGGAYAGSQGPPFGIDTEPHPLNPYGRAKLDQEVVVARHLSGRIPITIGRVANAYGPGQNIAKRQGLVTELCLCALTNRIATIFAPMTTLRDYIYADDIAAAVVVDLLRMAGQVPDPYVLRVVASGRSTSIAELLVLVERATGRPIAKQHTFTGSSHLLDLRLEGIAEPLFRNLPMTPLEVGISLVFQDLLARLGAGTLVGVRELA